MSDDLLTTLLTDAVADVEPEDRFAEIRAGIDGASARRRTWWVAGGGTALAVAASIAVIVVSSTPREAHRAVPPVGPGTPSTSTAPAPTIHAIPVYYVGGPPEAPVLYREFHSTSADDLLTASIRETMTDPQDPDYRSSWHPGDLGDVAVRGDVITIEVTDPEVRTSPASMSEAEAQMSVQQLVYTAQAAAQQRLPVQFTYEGNPLDQVLGVPTSEPIVNAPVLDTLSRVQLTSPAEGEVATGSKFLVDGAANSYEANVLWLLEDGTGRVVDQGNFTAEGWMGHRLFEFHGFVDVSSLDPGTYSLIVSTDDPSGGAEGNGVSTDSRTVVID